MGCDIHTHFEIRVDGEWLHYSSPRINRNYDLFYKMAGVRGGIDDSIKPISTPRGLPEDISKTTSLESKWIGVDGHSHSWLNADEIKEISPMIKGYDAWGYLAGNGWGEFKEYPEDYPKEIQDIRLVFWFDN